MRPECGDCIHFVRNIALGDIFGFCGRIEGDRNPDEITSDMIACDSFEKRNDVCRRCDCRQELVTIHDRVCPAECPCDNGCVHKGTKICDTCIHNPSHTCNYET